MESFLDSPVTQWFLSLRSPSLAQLSSPFAVYVECLPALSTIVVAVSFAILSRSFVPSSFVGIASDLLGVIASWIFLRYVWFHGFVYFRYLCEVYLEMRHDFTRRFVEPGLAATIATSLLFIAWRQRKAITAKRAHSIGDASDNVNNSAISRVHSSDELLSASTNDVGDIDGNNLLLLGQLHYCQRCGKIMYETVADPVVPGQLTSSPTLPRALIIRGDGRRSRSASPTREMKCENCLRIQSSREDRGGRGSGLLRGSDSRNVNFAVGPHNLGETRVKGILRSSPN